MRHKSKIATGILLTAGFMTAVFWNQPVYRYYKLSGKGLLKNMKIIMLSDLHNTIYGKNQSKLLEMITKEEPDLIVACGDISDERTDMTGSVLLFEGLQDKYPLYFISGNHEHWMNHSDDVFNVFDNIGAIRLENRAVEITIGGESITLIGVNDPDSTLYRPARASLTEFIDEAMEDVVEKQSYKILMSHRPEHIDLYKNYEIDLVLSGHAHGGQLRIPSLLNGLYAPNQGFFPKYAGGYYEISDQLDFIVGRGLSCKRHLPRVMNPPEVVVIEFD